MSIPFSVNRGIAAIADSNWEDTSPSFMPFLIIPCVLATPIVLVAVVIVLVAGYVVYEITQGGLNTLMEPAVVIIVVCSPRTMVWCIFCLFFFLLSYFGLQNFFRNLGNICPALTEDVCGDASCRMQHTFSFRRAS